MKPGLIKYLISEGCDTKEKLRAASQIITGTLRVNSNPPPFVIRDGYIFQG